MGFNWETSIISIISAAVAFFSLLFGFKERSKRKDAEDVLEEYREVKKGQTKVSSNAVVKTADELKKIKKDATDEKEEFIPPANSVDERIDRLRKSDNE